MSREPEQLTLSEVVARACGVCDPEGQSESIERLLAWFEDRDEPVTAVADVDSQLAEATTAIDPEGDDPALAMARAVAVYLAHRRDEIDDDRTVILRLAVRAEFGDEPPEPVAGWLVAEGVT